MFAELHKQIEDLAKRASGAKEVQINDNNPAVAHVYNAADGKIVEYDRKPPNRSHTLSTIASYADAYQRYAALGEPSVWVSLKSVVCVINDSDDEFRQHRLTLPVSVSPLFATVNSLPGEQEALLQAIRHDLKPAQIAPDTFELAIANLKWQTTDTAEGQYGTVKSTMGRSINAEVKGEKDIPPEIEVTFEPFPELCKEFQKYGVPSTVTVVCSVHMVPADREIIVKPYPGQIGMAQAEAVELLRRVIAEAVGDDVSASHVFAGTP